MECLNHYYELIGKKTVDALNNHNFKAYYASDISAVIAKLMALIPDGASVGLGGSVTLSEIRIKRLLIERGLEIYTHTKLSPEKALIARRKQLTADVFVASANAVTLKGEIVNTDATGNRVASMTFGPKRVVLIVGANKIVRDETEARARIKLFSAPVNAAALKKKTPCAVSGICVDCNSLERICCVTAVLHRAPVGSDFHVIVAGQNLGF